jgi:hypothetical protein
VALVAALCGLVSVGAASGAREEKVWLCHGTASETNPYVLIHVSESALAGHFDGSAPGHGERNHPDYLAAGPDDVCGTGGGEGGEGGEGGGGEGGEAPQE